MPNFGLVINSTYNPMSFEQYAAPFEKYAQVYGQMADAFDTLEMEANKWEKLAQESGSENSYKQYTTYAKELRQAAQDLAENGLTNKTRSTLSNLRNKYASTILPIEEKYEYRQKLIEEQRKANPTGDIQWTTDYANMGLDNLNLTSSYSGRKLSDIEKEGFEQAAAYSSRISQSTLALAGDYYRIRQGAGQQYADAFLQNIALGNDSNYSASSVKELTDLFNYIKQSQGIGISDSPYTTEQDAVASDRLASGILKGLTMKDSYQIVRDDINNGTDGSGGGKKTTPLYNAIGYALIVDGKEYTEVNEGGTTVYYDKDGNKYTQKIIGADDNGNFIYGYANDTNYIDFAKQTEDEKKLSKERFAIISADDTSYNMYIVDLWDRDSSGQPKKITQDGKVVRFDNRTQLFNPVTRKIEDKQTQKESVKGTKFRLQNDQVLEIEMNPEVTHKIEERLVTTKEQTAYSTKKKAPAQMVFTSSDFAKVKDLVNPAALDKEIDNINGDTNLNTEEKAQQITKLKYSYYIYQNLPDYVKDDPNGYTIQLGALKNEKSNRVIKIITKTPYSNTTQSSEGTNEEPNNSSTSTTFDPNKTE